MRAIASMPRSGREPCAARPVVSISKPTKPLVGDRDLHLGRLGDHRGVGLVAAATRLGADAGHFLVDDRGHDDVPAQPASRRLSARRQDRRQPAFMSYAPAP